MKTIGRSPKIHSKQISLAPVASQGVAQPLRHALTQERASPLPYSDSVESHCSPTGVLPMEFPQKLLSRQMRPLQYGLTLLFPLFLFVTLILLTTPGAEGSRHTPGSPGTMFFVLSRHTPSVMAIVFKLFGSGVKAVGITSLLCLSYSFQLPPTGGSFMVL